MSRMHEAIKKAAMEQFPPTAANMSTVEAVLSTSYSVGAPVPSRATRTDGFKRLPSGSLLLHNVHPEDWLPNKKAMLFYGDAPDGSAREQFRSLRTKLYELRSQREISIISIASSLSGEGKSFVAANLAHVLALQRERTALLIDGDMRRGSIAGLLGARSTPGLTEYLQNQEPLHAILQRGAGGNLYLIPGGVRISEPGELISSARLRALLAELRPLFDWIVIDTPPAVQFADAGVLADLCDGTLMVVGAGLTPVPIAKRAVQQLRPDRILGMVLNRGEDTDRAARYFSYYKEAKDS